jgi:3-hydroxyisobutyrate dehydrogenase-like beta-hydroxyacid dehydrogenase
MSERSRPTVGVVGLGMMGAAMADAFVAAGLPVVVFDIVADKMTRCVAAGAQSAASAKDVAAASDVVISCVYSPADAQAAALDPDTGIVVGLQPGAVYVDCTTNLPEVSERIAVACRQQDRAFLDAPISGRVPDLTLMVGGSNEALDTARPLLSVIASDIVHIGTTGSGVVAKLVNQYLYYRNYVTAAQGLVIGHSVGLDTELLCHALSTSAGASAALPAARRGLLYGGIAPEDTPADGHAPLTLAAKDVHLVAQWLDSIGIHLPDLDVVLAYFDAGLAAGLGARPWPAVSDIIAAATGTTMRLQPSADVFHRQLSVESR